MMRMKMRSRRISQNLKKGKIILKEKKKDFIEELLLLK
jgi:hypothetical protein